MHGAPHRPDIVDAMEQLAVMKMINADHVMCVEAQARSGNAAKIISGGTACIIGINPSTSQPFEEAQSRMHCGVNAASQHSFKLV